MKNSKSNSPLILIIITTMLLSSCSLFSKSGEDINLLEDRTSVSEESNNYNNPDIGNSVANSNANDSQNQSPSITGVEAPGEITSVETVEKESGVAVSPLSTAVGFPEPVPYTDTFYLY